MEEKKEVPEEPAQGWSWDHTRYLCADARAANVGKMFATRREKISEDDHKSEESKNSRHAINGLDPGRRKGLNHYECRVTVSGAAMSRDMEKIVECSGDTATIVLPRAVRSTTEAAFQNLKSLRAIVVNEGRETLGANEGPTGEDEGVTFQSSAVQKIILPRTLKRVERNTFCKC